jgi:MFS family permease
VVTEPSTVSRTTDLRTNRLAVSAVFSVSGAAFATWAGRIPAVQDRLGLSPGGLGVALLGLTAGAVLALPLSGVLIARLGSRRTTRAAAVALCLILLLVPYAGSLPLLVAALALFGGTNSILDTAMNAQAVEVETGYGRPILSSFHGWWSLGGLAGSGVAALVARDVPVRTHFSVAGCVLLLTALVASRGLLGSVRHAERTPSFARPTKALAALGAIAFCGLLAEGAAYDWSAVYLRDGVGASPGLAATGFAAASLAMAACRFGADRVVGRLGAARFVQLAGLVSTAGIVLAVAVPHPAAVIVGFGLLGGGLAGIVPVVFSGAGRVAPDRPGPALAAVATLGYLGLLTGPAMIGGIGQVSSVRAGLTVVVLLTVLMTLLGSRVPPGAVPRPTEAQ